MKGEKDKQGKEMEGYKRGNGMVRKKEGRAGDDEGKLRS